MCAEDTRPEMSPAERCQKVAEILAAGLIRCRRTTRMTASSGPKESSPAPENCLEAPGGSRLSVPGGQENGEPEKGAPA